MTKGKRVYVAGPISKEPCEGVRRACLTADRLIAEGHYPYVPHLDRLWAFISGEKPYEQWLRLDFEWIRVCQAIVRCPGESAGADREIAFAKSIGIPVYYSVDEFVAAETGR